MEVQPVTLYRVSDLQRYGFTARGNVTSVYPPLSVSCLMYTVKCADWATDVPPAM